MNLYYDLQKIYRNRSCNSQLNLSLRCYLDIQSHLLLLWLSAHSGGLEEGVLGRGWDQCRRCRCLHDIRQREDSTVGHHGGGQSRRREKEEQVHHSIKCANTSQRNCSRSCTVLKDRSTFGSDRPRELQSSTSMNCVNYRNVCSILT